MREKQMNVNRRVNAIANVVTTGNGRTNPSLNRRNNFVHTRAHTAATAMAIHAYAPYQKICCICPCHVEWKFLFAQMHRKKKMQSVNWLAVSLPFWFQGEARINYVIPCNWPFTHIRCMACGCLVASCPPVIRCVRPMLSMWSGCLANWAAPKCISLREQSDDLACVRMRIDVWVKAS